MPSRRERIEAMLADDPRDTFLRYSLAVEWEKEAQIERSLAGFRDLMADSPPYIPAFFRAGQLLVAADRIPEARAALRDGIEAARAQGDAHAAGEMGELLTSLGSRGE